MSRTGDPAVQLRSVSKRYRRHRDRRGSLKELIVRGRPRQIEEFWALRNVSLSVPRGSVFGLLGHNGSGKSSALKVIGGITRPTSGSVVTQGRVAALIELGAGFHPDMTGRENIRLNGSILGLSRRDVESAIGEIIDFSGLDDFVDEPVKTYSSGMYVRLGFSVAVHMRPDVLLVDEVLAVGDEDFQRRCLDHLHSLRKSGCTIILVSHALGLVESLCDEVAWLDHGELESTGPASRIVEDYLARVNATEAMHAPPEPAAAVEIGARSGTGEVRVTRVELVDEQGSPVPHAIAGVDMRLRLWLLAREQVDDFVVGVEFHSDTGGHVTLNSRQTGERLGPIMGEQPVDITFPGGPLNSGHYRLHTAVVDDSLTRTFDRWTDAAELIVRNGPGPERYGMVTLPGSFRIARRHAGRLSSDGIPGRLSPSATPAARAAPAGESQAGPTLDG